MLTQLGWGLVSLCGVITVGSLVAAGFTLRRMFELRRRRARERNYALRAAPNHVRVNEPGGWYKSRGRGTVLLLGSAQSKRSRVEWIPHTGTARLGRYFRNACIMNVMESRVGAVHAPRRRTGPSCKPGP